MTTRSPRAVSRLPRLEAVRPLPSEEATPPVTKMCRVSRTAAAKACSRGHLRRSRGDEVREAGDDQEPIIHGTPGEHHRGHTDVRAGTARTCYRAPTRRNTGSGG